ncbi:PP2C family protein-serine/threonine phosphatase [Streptomyces hirsutus]|uniref:PP2C family protein-serine/threonine phosphatase n=1 Tax=Streptomyces hirsutus TaxID=35620 RepID=UPI003635390F
MPYVAVSVLSHSGLLREGNEDSLVVGPWTLCTTVTENPQTQVFPLGMPLVVAVTDGLGGHPGGDMASAMAVRRIASIGPVLSSQDAVRDALNACNRAVCEAAGGLGSELSTTGTTVAGVVVQPGSLPVLNVGDSRVFAASRGGLRQMSVDDSPPLDPGERTTPLITLCLGGTPVYRPIRPHVTATPVASGDRYLIFTDGLTDLLTTDVLDEVMGEGSTRTAGRLLSCGRPPSRRAGPRTSRWRSYASETTRGRPGSSAGSRCPGPMGGDRFLRARCAGTGGA